jgi:glutamate N-acetyltransferase/amino-acid N-acetyltransferase
VSTPRGFRAGAVYCGLKTPGEDKLDLGLLVSERPGPVAATFTTNKVAAAPVLLDRRRVADGSAQAVVFNAGNANACTGGRGLRDAERMAELSARKLGIDPNLVLVTSTGVIGVPLPMEKIEAGIAAVELTEDGGTRAARAIMTTDTRPKRIAVEMELGGATVRLGGMAKGAGMIHPNMATMLAYVTTDADVAPDFLQACLSRAVDDSFNMISVDGDTSTNDTVLLLANGLAGNPTIRAGSAEADAFEAGLRAVATHLAKEIARDGEGATHLIEAVVEGARSRDDAVRVARAIASSSLIKAMVYGLDPNWGRLACAAGYSGAELDQSRLTISIGDLTVARDGLAVPFDREAAREQLRPPEVRLSVDLRLGEGRAVAWGCDLTEGYVIENSSYTS